MFTRAVDRTAIAPLTLKDAAGIMQAMGQDMDLGITPIDHLAVEPDFAVTVVKRNKVSHGCSPRLVGVNTRPSQNTCVGYQREAYMSTWLT